MTDVSNTDKVIDSRDVIARIEELESEREAYESDVTAADEELADASDDTSVIADEPETLAELGRKVDEAKQALADWDHDNSDELKVLKSFAEDGENSSSEWTDGATLVHEDYWTEYVQELLEDIGDLPKDLPYYIVIDWDSTAENIRSDYSSVDFDGETYWVR